MTKQHSNHPLNYKDQEVFSINDLDFDIVPSDIRVMSDSFVTEETYMRSNAVFVFKSKHANNRIVINLSFTTDPNMDKDQEFNNSASCIQLLTQVSKYPFCFIKSKRLESYVAPLTMSRTNYMMYAIDEVNVHTFTEVEGVIFLELVLVYFNHAPLIADFTFRNTNTVTVSTEENSREAEDQTDNKPLKVRFNEVSRTTLGSPEFKNDGKTLYNLSESAIWKKYFQPYHTKVEKELLILKETAPNYSAATSQYNMGINILAPVVTAVKDFTSSVDDFMSIHPSAKKIYITDIDGTNDDDYESGWTQYLYSQDFSHIDTSTNGNTDVQQATTNTPVSAATENAAGAANSSFDPQSKQQTAFINWKGAALSEDMGIGIQSISISKKNRLAIHPIGAHKHPVIQYMGRYPTSIQIKTVVNNKDAFISESSISSFIKHAINQLDFNRQLYPEALTYNYLKIESLLTTLMGVESFLPVQEQITASADSQGVESFVMVFKEGDLSEFVEQGTAITSGKTTNPLSDSAYIQLIIDYLDKLATNLKNAKTAKKNIDSPSTTIAIYNSILKAMGTIKDLGTNTPEVIIFLENTSANLADINAPNYVFTFKKEDNPAVFVLKDEPVYDFSFGDRFSAFNQGLGQSTTGNAAGDIALLATGVGVILTGVNGTKAASKAAKAEPTNAAGGQPFIDFVINTIPILISNLKTYDTNNKNPTTSTATTSNMFGVTAQMINDRLGKDPTAKALSAGLQVLGGLDNLNERFYGQALNDFNLENLVDKYDRKKDVLVQASSPFFFITEEPYVATGILYDRVVLLNNSGDAANNEAFNSGLADVLNNPNNQYKIQKDPNAPASADAPEKTDEQKAEDRKAEVIAAVVQAGAGGTTPGTDYAEANIDAADRTPVGMFDSFQVRALIESEYTKEYLDSSDNGEGPAKSNIVASQPLKSAQGVKFSLGESITRGLIAENIIKAFKYFTTNGPNGKAWTPAQAAGIVGNLMSESGQGVGDPTGPVAALKYSLRTSVVGDLTLGDNIMSGKAFGIAQWRKERVLGLRNFAQVRDVVNTTFDQQLAYVNFELGGTHKNAGNALRTATTPEGASLIFQQKFEVGGVGGETVRQEQARVVHEAMIKLGMAPAVTPEVVAAKAPPKGSTPVVAGIPPKNQTTRPATTDWIPSPVTNVRISSPWTGSDAVRTWTDKGKIMHGHHYGIDLAFPVGTQVWAAANGVVVRSTIQPEGAGEYIEIDHLNGYTTTYMHLSKRSVNVGDKVAYQQIIGLTGATGRSRGPHLHYQVNVKGKKDSHSKPLTRDPSNLSMPLHEMPANATQLAQLEAQLPNTVNAVSNGDDFDPVQTQTRKDVTPENSVYNEDALTLAISDIMTKEINTGLMYSVPTFKVYITIGNEDDDWLYGQYTKTQYFELRGIKNIHLNCNNDENPIDVLSMVVADPSFTASDNYGIVSKYFESDLSKIGTDLETQFAFNKLKLLPGMKLHVRVGYSNDPNDLPIIFNGSVVTIDNVDFHTLQLTCEGFGKEFMNQILNPEAPGTIGGSARNCPTSTIVGECMLASAITNFGKIYTRFEAITNVGTSFNTNAAGNGNKEPTDPDAKALIGTNFAQSLSNMGNNYLFSWNNINPALKGYAMSSKLFTNIFTVDVENRDREFRSALKNLGNFAPYGNHKIGYKYYVWRQTPWEAIKQLEFRHPGTLCKPMMYEDRMTLFFGIKEQAYFYRDLSRSLMLLAGGKLKEGDKSDLTEYMENRRLRLKPAVNFHLISSAHNMISNGLSLNNDYATCTNVSFYNDNDTDNYSNLAKWGSHKMYMNANINQFEIREKELVKSGCYSEYQSFLYGTKDLMNEAEKMYDGRIFILGNPEMKAGDYAFINDEERRLRGTIKIRECYHHIDENNGYVTEIVPGQYVEPANFLYSMLFTKLGLAANTVASKLHYNILSSTYNANDFKMLTDLLRFIEDFNNTKGNTSNLLGFAAGAGVYAVAGYTTWLTNKILGNIGGVTSKLGGIGEGRLPKAAADFTRVLFGGVAQLDNLKQTSFIKGLKEGADLMDKAKAAGVTAKDLARDQSIIFKGKLFNYQAVQKVTKYSQKTFGYLKGVASKSSILTKTVGVGRKAGGVIKPIFSVGSRISMFGLQKGLRAAFATVAAVGASNPLTLILEGLIYAATTIAFTWAGDLIEESELTRQPLLFFPLLKHGKPYTAGMSGAIRTDWFTSKKIEFDKTLEELHKSSGFIMNSRKVSGQGGLISSTAGFINKITPDDISSVSTGASLSPKRK